MKADTLKKSILQWAIEGKLVPQLESEPAVKQLGEAPEDVPFAIPEKWKWVRLRNLVSIAKQKIPDSDFYYIDVSGIDSVKRKICTLKKLTAGNAPSRARKVVEQGMVLYSTVRPYLLNTVVVEEIFDKFDLIASTAFATFKCLADLNNHYVWYVLQSPYFTQHVSAIQKGVAYPAVSDRDFYSSYIPIPPIEEQRRIVTKLNELLPLVETYGKEQEALEKMEKEFPDKLRASLLQEAIQGKLVPQLESEPEVEQIGEAPEDVPFAIPEKWKWNQLLDIFDIYQPKTISTKELNPDGNYFVYGANGIIGKYTDYNHENSEVVIACRGATCGAVNITKPKSWINGNAMVVKPINNLVCHEYLVAFLKFFNWNQVTSGSAQPQITRKNLSSVLFPVPPIEEQRRIVAKLNELLDSVRQLEHNVSNP